MRSARSAFCLMTLLAGLSPVAAFAQSSQEWQQFGQALGNALLNNNGNPPPRPQNQPSAPRQYQYQAPNTSGQANLGGFNGGNDFFGPQPNSGGGYVRPQPQYQPNSQVYRPQYQPSYPSGSQYNPQYSSGGTIYQDPPAPPKTYSQLPILIDCPAGIDGQCHYELINAAGKAYPYDIHSGEKQTFPESTEWLIRYEQGQGHPLKTYRLRGGKNYSLQRDAQGLWQLYLAS